jgi:hypothetical protein
LLLREQVITDAVVCRSEISAGSTIRCFSALRFMYLRELRRFLLKEARVTI